MKKLNAIRIFIDLDKEGKYVFNKNELSKLFAEDSPKALAEGINRLLDENILDRVCRGVYINPRADSHLYTIEHIAQALRPLQYNYVSLESILSEYGVISQIPMDRLTVMTTGREAVYKTYFGVIEFTHTKRSIENLKKRTLQVEGRPLPIASKQMAWRDLKRVGRNVGMVDIEEINND